MKKAVVIAVIAVTFSCVYADTSEYPVGNPLTDRFWILSREIYGRGFLNGYEYGNSDQLSFNSQHSTDSFYSDLYSQFKPISQNNDNSITAGAALVSDFNFGDSNQNYFKLFPYLNINLHDNINLNVLYRIDPEADNDPRYQGKSFSGMAGYAEYAMIEYVDEHLQAGFGLKRTSWGFGYSGNLLLDKAAMPMTNMFISYKRSIFDFEFITGFLSPLSDELDSSEYNVDFFPETQRYISAHSLTIKPCRSFSISLRESVVYGGPGRRFEPAYAFPLIWYHGHQLNSRIDDNTLFGFGVDYRLQDKVWLYGELLIDDFQIEKKTRGDYEPDELGFILGGEYYDLVISRSTLAFEYARINNRTYNQGRPHNRYINRNMPIGYPLGPDCDLITGRIDQWLNPDFRCSLEYSYIRKGEGAIDDEWTTPWLDVDNYSEPFPTGVVEKAANTSLSLLYFGNKNIWGSLKYDYFDFKNSGNIKNHETRDWRIKLEIGLNYSISPVDF